MVEPFISKRAIGFALCAMLSALSFSAEAQQTTKIPRIGFLGGDANNARPNNQSLREGLRDLSYVEGKNIFVEDRYIERNVNEYSGLVVELLQLKVDVLVVEPLLAIRAAKKASQTIP